MKFLTIVLLSIYSVLLSAQVDLIHFPKDNSFYPREKIGVFAFVPLTVALNNIAVDSIFFNQVSSDGQQLEVGYEVQNFPYDTIEIMSSIHAGLTSYDFQVSLKKADSTWVVATAHNVIAGDVIMVQGQSNAQAIFNSGDGNSWQSNFIRCFGNPDPANYLDTTWYMAEANGYFTPGAVGQWPLRMASLLVDSLQMPIAIINGADPGKPIEFFQRNDAFPTDPATNYGRLLQRMKSSKLAYYVRAIIYYQGESDGDRAEIHKTLFTALQADWQEDFPNVETYYGIQVREGCGAPSLQLRQYQKEFEGTLPRFKSMTANGVTGHDGCHYSLDGYRQIGEKMYKQLAEDLYGLPSGQQLNVRVLSAEYTNATNTQITLTTDASSLVAQAGSGADFKLLNANSTIIGISVAANQIVLDLDQPVYDSGVKISYAGHSGDVNGWVLNGDGHGLYTFYNMPIGNHHSLPNFDNAGIMSGPGNCLVLDGVDDCVYIGPALNQSYTKETWVNWQGGGLGNNLISGAANTAFWAPSLGNGYFLAAGHNGAWGQVIDPSPLIPFQWTHVAVTYDDSLSQMRLYKNGNLVSQADNVPPHNDPELYIGAYVGVYTFQGKMDEVRIWDYARSQEEIRGAMCHKLHGDEPGLTSYFRFDQQAGTLAHNSANTQAGQCLGTTTPNWQRSAAPIGTKSTYLYQDSASLSLALASGDSLVLTALEVPDFVHLYFTEEIPNVLQPSDGHVLVDNTRYFGLYYPYESIDSFALTYRYKGNPFTMVDEPRLSLLKRRNNAQPYWQTADSIQLDFTANTLLVKDNRYQEYILAIKENTVSTFKPSNDANLLYPNPTNGFLWIRGLSPELVSIFDVRGKKCFEQKSPGIALDIRSLSPGVYLVEVRGLDAGVYQQKIIVL